MFDFKNPYINESPAKEYGERKFDRSFCKGCKREKIKDPQCLWFCDIPIKHPGEPAKEN